MATPEEMAASMIANLPEKTGKDLNSWLKVIDGFGLEKHGQIVKKLKTDHGLTHGFANLLAHKYREGDAPASEPDLVGGQYSGAKEGLKPIYDALIEEIMKFGEDVTLAPKKAYVSLRRNKQFGIIQPSTKTRVDVGLNLKDLEPTERLEASGSFNQMVSHRVRLSKVEDVDEPLITWLRHAYEQS